MRQFKDCRRIVVKAGTSILANPAGRFERRHFSRFCSELLSVKESGRELVVVSSGSIGMGMDVAGLQKRPKTMQKLQACAAIGQGKLMHAYEQFFLKKDIHTAQILLTREGLENKQRFLSAKNTLQELIKMNVVPVVNENDTVSTEEISFGDNDTLSVYTAHLAQAELLIILTDVDGFFLRDGSRVRLVTSKKEIDEELVKHVKQKQNQKTVGGMETKLRAASTAMKLGIPLLLINGHKQGEIARALNGEDVGTFFLPAKKRRSSKQMWIAFSAPRKGRVVVDQGAYEALTRKNVSLLPRGMTKIEGSFERGHVVELATEDGKVFGRGVTRYSNADLQRLCGKKTSEIADVLGYKYHDEVIHRNDIVLWE